MKNLKSIVLTLAIVMLSASFGFSQKGMNGQMGQGEPMIFKVIPNLTQAQKDKITADRTAMMKKVTPLQAEMQVKKAQMGVLMTKNSTLKEKEDLAKQMSDLRLQMLYARMEHHDNIRNLLTDDQKVVFDKWMLNRHNRMDKGMGNRMGNKGCKHRGKGNGKGMNK